MHAPSPRVWIATFSALLILAGASIGIVIDRVWLRAPVAAPVAAPAGAPAGRLGGPPPPGPPIDVLVRQLDDQLSLTADERQHVASILEAHRPALRALQDDARQKFDAEQASLERDIAAALTPDQAVKFRAMMAARPLGPRGGPGGPGRGRPGGPPRGRE
jgi:Spy/CpxP family protein refolding chaperone